MTRENWFITNVIREICQNSYVKRDDDPTSPLLPCTNETLFAVFSCGTIYSLEILKNIRIFRFSLFFL